MKLYERFGDKGFHTSIMTTFGIDFAAYEGIVLPRLRGAGCYNNLLIADGGMLSYALDTASSLPRHAGRHYTVATATATGVFHPKITVQLGRRNGRLLITSANVTASGLAGNREIASIIDCTTEESGERRLVAAAWQYVSARIDRDQQALAHQLEWMRQRTRWLLEAEPADGPVILADGSVAAFIVSGEPTGIGARYAAFVGGEAVERLIVLSPYWDEDLNGLKQIATALNAKQVIVLIDSDKQLFPGAAIPDVPQVDVYDLADFSKDRFVHAKLFVTETASADHVLFGSANCTVAALGVPGFAGLNAEACLYRQLPPKTIMRELGLAELLEEASPLQASGLPEYRKDEELPLGQAALRSPGRFECVFDTLFWGPPSSMQREPERIELMDATGRALPATLIALRVHSEKQRRYQITGLSERPSFARLHFADKSMSAPAVITLVDAMRETVKEARGKKAESAATQLAEGTEEELWLLEVMNDLEAAEAAQLQSDDPGVRRKRRRASDGAPDAEYMRLDYAQFIAGRRIRSDDHGISRNSLAGTELSLVRNFLNRILAVGETPSNGSNPLDAEETGAGLDLGDEISDAQSALESGEEFHSATDAVTDETQEQVERKRAARQRATREQIADAVNQFGKRVRDKTKAGEMTSFDVLRLRAILTIVAAAGQPIKAKTGHKTSSLQVLPLDDSAESWPMLMGRILFTFFGGNQPLIQQVKIEAIHDQIPDDILECWATCFWAIQTCALAANSHEKLKQSSQRMISLMQDVYALTGLRGDEMNSDLVMTVIEQMNERFTDRLGLERSEIEQAHLQIIKKNAAR